MVEPTERPELKDFLFGSGVVLEEDGVEIFRGTMDGERDEARTSVGALGGRGGFAVGVEFGEGCIDIRFIRRVSVGLIVLAPSPVA